MRGCLIFAGAGIGFCSAVLLWTPARAILSTQSYINAAIGLVLGGIVGALLATWLAREKPE